MSDDYEPNAPAVIDETGEIAPICAITPAQAKIDAVAKLTEQAMLRASELRLTTEESKALAADFPDEAFRTGAAGKDNLIYLEHASIRQRLNESIGIGHWAIVPRSRWAEEFEYFKDGKPQRGVKVYVEAMLIIRGCYVAEAVGDMDYYPSNRATNYGDAVEGAKSAALRRCAKELGVGLQAWHKSFSEEWMKRQKTPRPSGGANALETARKILSVAVAEGMAAFELACKSLSQEQWNAIFPEIPTWKAKVAKSSPIDANLLAEWTARLDSDPSLGDLNHKIMPEFAALPETPTKQAIRELINARTKAAGLVYSQGKFIVKE